VKATFMLSVVLCAVRVDEDSGPGSALSLRCQVL
jgi:hypothetical protein